MKILKNVELYKPKYKGKKDILIGGGKILMISNKIEPISGVEQLDLKDKIMTPGFIDQHIHITGAGGKRGFSSITPEIKVTDLIKLGITTVVGLLGTDGTTKNIKSLYSKVKSLEMEGISAYMFTGYYGINPVYLMNSLEDDMVFNDKILGCKIAISDIRSSYPSDIELLRLLKAVRVGGMISNKKGILHVHLGNLKTKMDQLFRIIKDYKFPIKHISPTHVGRTFDLFSQAIEFAKMGGIIDISTGVSKYTAPHKSVIYALEKGVSIDNMTFSSDGNAGLDKIDDKGNYIGVKKAPISETFKEVINLIDSGISTENSIKLVTENPAKNLGLKNKGKIELGYDADICIFNKNFKLTEIFCKGKLMMNNSELLIKNTFE